MNDHTPNPRVALVLGSGGLKCAASLGVWQVLHQAGIGIDMTVGCSGGSLYAAAIALGFTLEESVTLTAELWTAEVAQHKDRRSLLRTALPRLFGFDIPRYGFVDDRLLLERLRQPLGDLTFADAQLPVHMAATDLLTGEAVTLSTGRLLDAIRASIAIPFVFPPWPVNGRLLVDGGVTNPLPIDVAIREAADVIVAVGFENPYQTSMQSVGDYLLQIKNIHVMNLQKANFAYQHAAHHTEIVPVMVHFNDGITLTDTDKTPEIIAAGETAARAQLPHLRRILELSRTRLMRAGDIWKNQASTLTEGN